MLSLFDRHYARGISFGIIALVWFGALFEAAHNVWAASLFFGGITLLSLILCIGRIRDKKRLRFPLLFSFLAFLLALGLSFWKAFDLDTASLEFWGWFFSLLGFYVWINTIESERDIDHFFCWGGLIVIPILFHCIWQRISPPLPVDGIPPTVGLFGTGFFEIPFSKILTGHGMIVHYGHWEIHANLVNSVVLGGFILYWTLFYWRKATSQRRYVVLFGACLLTLGFTRSVWAFIALSAGFAFYYRLNLMSWAVSHRKVTSAAIVGVLAFLSLIFYVKMNHQVERPSDTAYYHASSRAYYWLTALRMCQAFPGTGVGLGGFATAYPHFKTGETENTLFAHGFLPQLLAETGAAGLIALALVGFTYIRLRRRFPDKRFYFQDKGLDATLVVILCFSLISINMDFLLNKFMFILLLAATLPFKAIPSFRIRPLWIGTAGGCLLLISAFWLNLLMASRLYTSGLYWERQGDPLKAITLYSDAILTDPFHANSYVRLSSVYEKKYQTSHSPEDLASAKLYLQKALRYKNDIRFSDHLRKLNAG